MEVNVSFCTLVALALVSMICGAESVYRRINTAHRASGLVKPENWSSRDLIYLWGPLTSVFTHGVMSCRMQLNGVGLQYAALTRHLFVWVKAQKV